MCAATLLSRKRFVGVAVIFVILALLCAITIYTQALKTGMPQRRWLTLALFSGPIALILFRVHYRRAWLRRCGNLVRWLP